MNAPGLRWRLLAGIVTLSAFARGAETASTPGAPGVDSTSSQHRAQAWFDEGQAAYARGEFDIAAALFRAVYIATPTPAILYDLAQAERRARQCTASLAHYEEYLRLEAGAGPSDVDEKIAEVRQCAEEEKAAAPQTATESPPVSPAPVVEARRQEAHGRSTVRAVAYGAIGGALLTAAFGTVYLIRAESASRELEQLNAPGQKWGDRYASYQAAYDVDRGAAVGFFIASGVMAVAATSLLLVRWPGDARKDAASVGLGTRGSLLGMTYTAPF